MMSFLYYQFSTFNRFFSGKSIAQNVIGTYSSGTVADFHGIPFSSLSPEIEFVNQYKGKDKRK
ncbi:MAG: hypothetical protein GZ091_00915 [Paludibacter sp.]|nr:hypothetical protein [Paludibacter sp.]